MRDPSRIEQKIALAEQFLQSCCFCEHKCGVDRRSGDRGRCGCDATSHAYLEDLLWAEEEFITPSYAVFLAGCNMRCAFCYADEANQRPDAYELVNVDAVSRRVRECATRPVSFSLIGGEPSVHLHTALRLIAAIPPDMSVVWNSNFYFSEEAASLLADAVDVFVADFHFGNNECASSVAGAPQYLETATRNLRWAAGAATLVVRHLALPGHLECCAAPALRWLAAELPHVYVHVLANYLPPESRQIPGMDRHLSESEAAEVLAMVEALELRSIE